MNIEVVRIIAGLILSIALLVAWPRVVRMNSFFGLLLAAVLFAMVVGIPIAEAIHTMQIGFGNLLQQIGIVVALGSVLGILLEKTGAMEVISASLLKLFGTQRPALALAVMGALTGIPVFCDSGFIILSRLIPSLAAKASVAGSSLTLSLSAALYATHTLVPPTPGPLAAAATVGLGNQLGTTIWVGLVASIPVVLVSWLYALRRGKIPSTLVAAAEPERSVFISVFRAYLPLLVPIVLIALASFGELMGSGNIAIKVLSILGIPIVALSIGILLALTLVDIKHHADWRKWTTQALSDAGIILLIIGAGGAFGAVIKSSHLSQIISSLATDEHLNGLLFLVFAWLVGALLKTAQGSTTSAMIITSSLVAPLAAAAGLESTMELSALVVAIGGGAMTVSHANDAYFWVVSEFGGVHSKDLFKLYTPMTLLQGITALLMAMVIYSFL